MLLTPMEWPLLKRSATLCIYVGVGRAMRVRDERLQTCWV